VSLLERDTRNMVDRLQYIVLSCIPTQFSSALGCFKMVRNSSILIGQIFWLARTSGPENELTSPDVFTLLARAWWARD